MKNCGAGRGGAGKTNSLEFHFIFMGKKKSGRATCQNTDTVDTRYWK